MAFSAYNPASILRRNTTERIGQMLKTGGLKPMLTITRSQDAVGPNLDPGYTDLPRNFQHGAFVPNAGAYGAGVTLPIGSSPPDPLITDAGPIEPDALPQPVMPSQPSDYYTRIDPNMGPINPTLTITPGNNGLGGGGNGIAPISPSYTPVQWQQNAASNHNSGNGGPAGGRAGGYGEGAGSTFASILPGGYGNMGFAQGGGGYITQLLLRQAGY